MQENLFQQWMQRFCHDAAEDEMSLFRIHMEKQDLPDEPDKLLRGTILVVSACCAYLSIEGQPLKGFLSLQTYHPMNKESASYALTFNLFNEAYARILTSNELMGIDLADLFDHPWDEFEACGFREFSVSRVDGNELSKDEIDHIEKVIEDDLRYDFTEEEVDFWTDPDRIEGVLMVCIYDKEDRFD